MHDEHETAALLREMADLLREVIPQPVRRFPRPTEPATPAFPSPGTPGTTSSGSRRHDGTRRFAETSNAVRGTGAFCCRV
jgi:hypothetical protein